AAAVSSGLNINRDVSRLELWAADASGNPLVPNGSGGYTSTSTYQYIRVETSQGTTTYRYVEGGPLQRRSGANWVTHTAQFNGVIYVDGDVSRFTGPARVPSDSSNPDNAPPALASFAQITVAADDHIRITGDLKYETPPCSGVPTRNADDSVTPATCDNLDAVNVLGIYTQDGNVLIGNDHS